MATTPVSKLALQLRAAIGSLQPSITTAPYPQLSSTDATHTILPAALDAAIAQHNAPPPIAVAAATGSADAKTAVTARKSVFEDTSDTAAAGSQLPSNDWMIISGFIILNHFLAVYTLIYVRSVPTGLYIWCGIMAFLGQLGASAGYHRYWSHRSFEASLPLQIFLALIGPIAFQGSAKWWAMRHRIHHRFVDTDADPYNSTRGLFYSHMGWLILKPRYYSKLDTINADDLKSDPVVQWQARSIGPLYLVVGFWLPAAIGSWYGTATSSEGSAWDAWAGFLWVGVMARMIAWHGMWSVNSFAHYSGLKPYQSTISATNNYLVALISHGEGNHNYHHEYPKDYRHGVQWYEADVSKWCIYIWEQLGLARRLHRTDPNSVSQSMLQMWERAINKQRTTLKWGSASGELPVMTFAEYQRVAIEERRSRDSGDPTATGGRLLVKISDLVVDVQHFQSKHPGGAGILRSQIGLDATRLFFGGANLHTNGSFNLVRLYAVARVVDPT